MNESFDPAVLTAYLLDELRPDAKLAVARAALTDTSLAAKLDCMAALIGVEAPGSAPSVPMLAEPTKARWTRRQFVKGAAASLAGVAALSGAAYAGYRLLVPRPLLEDDFDKEWLDPAKWDTLRMRRGVRPKDGYVRLRNRGSLVTMREFDTPFELSFDWTWINWVDDPLYPETLSIALHTSGRLHSEWPFEVEDGIVLVFQTHSARIGASIHNPRPMTDRVKLGWVQIGLTGTVPLPADALHRIRIVDTGAKVSVYATGPKIDHKYATKQAIFELEYAEKFAERRIAIYNREPVANTDHESRIDNFKVYRLGD